MTRRRWVVAILAALLIPLVAAKCTGADTSSPPAGGPVAAAPCDDSCDDRPDTVAVHCIWKEPQTAKVISPLAEATWTKSGVQQNIGNDQFTLTTAGRLYAAWEQNWRAQRYPKISVTCDSNVPDVKIGCSITYAVPGKTTVKVDSQVAGRPPVNCNTDAWLNGYLNHGD